MLEIAIKILGYLPTEFLWIYIVFILILFFILFGIIFKLLGGDL